MSKYLHNITYNFFAQIACLILGLVSNILIARLLGPEGKGVITLLSNYISMIVIILMFGMSESNVYYISRRTFKQEEVFSSIFFHTIVVSVIFFSASFLLRDILLKTVLKNIQIDHFMITTVIFPFQFLFLHLITFIQGFKQLKAYSLTFVCRALAMLVFQVILIPHLKITGGLIAFGISVLVVDIINFFRIIKFNKNWRLPNFTFLAKSFLFGIKSQIGLLLSFFERRLDFFIVNIFLDPIQVGYYAAAVVMAELPWYLPNAVGTVIFPEIASKEKKEAFDFVAFICRNTLLITLLFCLVIGFGAEIFIKIIFGGKFLPAIIPLRFLLPGLIALATNRVICVAFSGTGRPELGTLTVVFSSIATVILDLVLIPMMGIRGAALASTISYFISAIVGIVIFRHISKLGLKTILLVSRSDWKKYPALINTFRGNFKK